MLNSHSARLLIYFISLSLKKFFLFNILTLALANFSISKIPNLPDLGDSSSYIVSDNDEREIIPIIKGLLEKDPKYLPDPLLNDYLVNLGNTLLGTTQAHLLSKQKFNFFLVQDITINAFATAGAFIGINTGLIAAAASKDELAAVMAHEIGHVLQKHYVRGAEKSARNVWLALAGIALGVLASQQSVDLTQGIIAGTQALAIDNILTFSKAAEREADRVGLQILQEAGFAPIASLIFFERLQRANIFNETNSSYFRTHPLTSQRIADIRNRIGWSQTESKQSFENFLEFNLTKLEYDLMRIRAQVLQINDAVFMQVFKKKLELDHKNSNELLKISSYYGAAVLAQQLKNFTIANKNLAKAQLLTKSALILTSSTSSASFILPFMITAIELAVEQEQLPKAIELSKVGLHNFPNSRAMAISYAKVLLEAGEYAKLEIFIKNQIKTSPDEVIWHDLLVKTYVRLKKPLEQHLALAEKFCLFANWTEALQQLELAKKLGVMDFYVMAKIDARIQEMKMLIKNNEKK